MTSGARLARRAACGIVAALATLGARPSHAVRPAPAVMAPSAVLARYAAALGALRRPSAVSFEYVVEQLGPRTLEQRHRVYRRGLDERDETLVVDGTTFSRPAVRIIRYRTYRYELAVVAPRAAAYAFGFRGTVRAGNHFVYIFKAVPRVARPFAASEVAIDGASFLPTIVRFKIAGGGAHGTGELAYGRSETFWVIQAARVSVRFANGTPAHERITWLNYRFPSALPPSTFQVPKPAPAEIPPDAPAELPAP